MTKRIVLFLLFFASMAIHAQEYQTLASQREAEADEYATKSYKRKDAYGAYLSAYRLYNLAGSQCNGKKYSILAKARNLLNEEKYMMEQSAVFVDSLISESFDEYKDSLDTFLPLLETYILKKRGSVDRYKRSFELFEIATSIRKRHNLQKGKEYENLLRWYSSHLAYNKEISNEDKLAFYAELWSVYRENCSDSDTLDVNLLDRYYFACRLKGNEETRVMLSELKMDYVIKKYGKESEEYVTALNTLDLVYTEKSKKDEKNGEDNGYKQKCRMVRNEIWKIMCARDEIYDGKAATLLRSLIYSVLYEGKDTVHARELVMDYSDKIKNKLGEDSDMYLESLDFIVSTYPIDAKALIPILEEKIKLEESKYGKDDYRYKATEMSLSVVYQANHMLSQAISTVQKSPKREYSQLVMEASMQVQYGMYREAIGTYNEILELCLTESANRTIALMISPAGISNCYYEIKDLKGLLEFGRKWTSHPGLTSEEQHSIFTNVMAYAGNPVMANDDVLKFVDEYITSHSEQMKNKSLFRSTLSGKASVLYGMSRFDDAIEVLQKILATIQSGSPDGLFERIKYTSYCEITLLSKQDYKKALEANATVISLLQQIPNYEFLKEYRSACARTCLCYDFTGDYSKILPVVRNIKSVDKTNLTQLENTLLDANNFFGMYILLDEGDLTKPLIHAYAHEGRVNEAKEMVLNILNNDESTIRFVLSRLNSNEKTNQYGLLNTLADNLFSVAMLQKDDSDLSQAVFDYCLLYKQAFLTSESLMRKQILESGDSVLIGRFTDLQNLKDTRQTLLQAGLDASAIEENISSLEAQIQEDSKVYGDYTRELNLKWRDIQSVLEDEDAVVEFLAYHDALSSENKVGAVVLCKGWSTPKMVTLCKNEELEQSLQSPDMMGKLIWMPIMNMLPNKKKIYFVPSGIINTIGVESAIIDGKFISERCNLLRLSSSRALVHKKDATGAQVVLYGGVYYSNDEIGNNSCPSDRAAEKDIPYLSGTKIEVETIRSLIDGMGSIPTELYMGHEATETSVRNIKPFATKVLHIATHGYFKPENIGISSSIVAMNNSLENDILSRSGLLLAHAQESLWGERTENTCDDGMLTSQEISNLDLRGTDLVVLSACETAKGEVTGDGVFGLQRGFKKAGVNSILMSLWKVDDEATCKLMTEFYTNWIAKKMTKNDALEAAKKVVRETKGWEDPKYWAAFILLDALD